MEITTWTFTGFSPSGNPFKWYHDATKRTSFITSLDVDHWSEKPKIGDKITLHRNEKERNYRVEKAFINDKIVFEWSEEMERKMNGASESLYDNLKKEKRVN